MARYSTALVAGLALCSAVSAQSNDSCSNATPLPLGGSVSGTTNPITTNTDGSSACGGSRDVWHTVYVECGGELTLYTCPAPFDTVLSVHTACPGTAGNQIACNDDSQYCGTAYPRASSITVSVSPGTYLVRVAGFQGATGEYTLNGFVTPATPANDLIANAAAIGDGAYAGCTSGATADGSATCGNSNTAPDVWYYYAAPCDGILDVYTCPASFDTVVSVYTDPPGTTATQIACNDDSAYCGAAYPRTSYAPVPVSGGHDYYIRVSGYNGAAGSFVLNTHLNSSTPVNDSCVNALPLTGGMVIGSTGCASTDGSTDCSFLLPGPDVWYRYTPACNGALTLYTCPASYDTMLSVHSGCPGTTGNQIACNDDSAYCGTAYPLTSSVTLPVTAGVPYTVRVSGFNGLTGTFALNADLACCYANCDGSTVAPVLNVADFTCFLQLFAVGNPTANCDQSTLPPVLNVADFTCFLQQFAAGCP